MAEWYEILIPIAALITASVALITIYFLKKQLKITEIAFNATKNASEINAFLTLQQNFTLNKSMSEVRRAISTKGPVLKKDGGPIDENDFDTYLEFVNRFTYYSNIGVIRVENIVAAFGSVVIEMEDNPYVMKVIKSQQKKYGSTILAGISQLAKKTRKLRPRLDSKD